MYKVGKRRKYCEECSQDVRMANRRKTQVKKRADTVTRVAAEKKEVDPKWLVRGTINTHRVSTSIDNCSS